MSKGATINARIDPNTKLEAKGVLNKLGMTMSEAIAIFLKQVVYQRAIPFDVKIPNELTAKTLREADEGKNVHRVSNAKELFAELDG